MNEVLDERVLEASVAAALDRTRNEQEKFPDQRLALEGELSLIQTRLHYLVEAIASCRSTGKVFDSLNEVEARKKVVVQELSTRDSLDQIVSLDAKRLTKDLRSRLGDIPALFARTYRRRVRCSESSWMDISCVNQLWKRGGRVIVSRQPGRLTVYSQE